MRTAVPSRPAPESALTSTGVPPSGQLVERHAGRDDGLATADPDAIPADAGHRPLARRGERQRAAVVPGVGGGDVGGARTGVVEAQSDGWRERADVARRVLERDPDRVLARPVERGDRGRGRRPSSGADSSHGPPTRHAFRRARVSGADCPPGSGSTSVRARLGFQPSPPSSCGSGSDGAVLSTRTTRSTEVQLPPASWAERRSTCSPSGHVRVSKPAPIAPSEQGTARPKSQLRASSCTMRPSSSIRPSRMPLLSAASNPTSPRPRSHAPAAVASAPRTPSSRGADGSSRYTRTLRSATNPWRASRLQRVALQRTSAWSRCVARPRSSSCIQRPNELRQSGAAPQPALVRRVLDARVPARVARHADVEVGAGDRRAGRGVEPQRRGRALRRVTRADDVAHHQALARLRVAHVERARQGTTCRPSRTATAPTPPRRRSRCRSRR